MAIFRLNRKEWEKDFKAVPNPSQPTNSSKKRKLPDFEGNEDFTENSSEKKGKKRAENFPGGGRRGVSSGLSTVIKHHHSGTSKSGSSGSKSSTGGKWWKTLETTKSASGSKGIISVKTTSS